LTFNVFNALSLECRDCERQEELLSCLCFFGFAILKLLVEDPLYGPTKSRFPSTTSTNCLLDAFNRITPLDEDVQPSRELLEQQLFTIGSCGLFEEQQEDALAFLLVCGGTLGSFVLFDSGDS
jgi:hypothetical protein